MIGGGSLGRLRSIGNVLLTGAGPRSSLIEEGNRIGVEWRVSNADIRADDSVSELSGGSSGFRNPISISLSELSFEDESSDDPPPRRMNAKNDRITSRSGSNPVEAELVSTNSES
jgi:hypothetical protein